MTAPAGTQYYTLGIGHTPSTTPADAAPPAVYATDSSGNVTGLVGVGGNLSINLCRASLEPYKLAFWGDSRYNSISATTTPDNIGSGTIFTQYRTPTWVLAHMGDAEFSRSYAVSGDAAVNWASASRSAGKTYIDLSNSDVDAVVIQYGINDIDSGGKTSAQVISYLQALISEIIKGGKFVIFESILPVNSPIASAATKQATINAVNTAMEAWIEETYNLQAIYVETAALLKGSDGLASYTYIAADGVHQNVAGAYLCGKTIATAIRQLLPKRIGPFRGTSGFKKNLLNLLSPSPVTTQFNVVEQGSATVTQSQGSDSNGLYYQWAITPSALNVNGLWQVKMEVSANFQTASPPYVALAGNEIIQGSARLVVDDGTGGTPNSIINVELRQRFYTGGIFNDWNGLVGTPTAIDTAYTEKFDATVHTPKLANTTASVVATPSVGAGLCLAAFVQGIAITGTVVVRMYNPQIRVVDYVKSVVLTAASFAIPATGVAYTNSSLGNQQVTIGGGTVSGLAVNGTVTGLTSGTFVLAPSDTLTPTYTVAPTWTVRQI